MKYIFRHNPLRESGFSLAWALLIGAALCVSLAISYGESGVASSGQATAAGIGARHPVGIPVAQTVAESNHDESAMSSMSGMGQEGHPAGSMEPIVLRSTADRVEAFTSPLAAPPVLTGTNITLVAQEADAQILPGAPTRMWTYGGTFPGPTIRRNSGEATYVTLVNSLPITAGSVTLHNHGGHSSPENDGQADTLLVAPGASRVYTYTNLEDGGNERGTLQFYHDHVMDVTARNLWMGMAGLFILDDPADPQTLPSGAYDVPLAIMDRAFDSNNQLIYQFSPGGVVGDTILVNGVVQPYFEVADRKYRFRILNAANFSQYDLELSTGQTMLQIGTESGLLPAPVPRQRILLGPAERADVVIDFAGQLGQNIVLNNLAGGGSTAQIIQFRVTRDETDGSTVPPALRSLPVMGTPVLTRTFEYGRTEGHWTINGLRYDPNRIDAYPVLGSTEKWILRNLDQSPHVFHLHDVDQVLVSRNGNPPSPYELFKESWNISGGQTIEVLIKFSDNLGKYVSHCHLVEHEDDGMMMQFEVVTTAITPSPTPTGPTATPTRTLTPTRTPTTVCTPTTVGVTIGDNFFSPQNSSVYVGTTVRWTNVGRRQHSSTSTTGQWDSGLLSEGQTFNYTFNSVGTFSYFCTEHGGMTGTITVVAGCAPTNTPSPGPTFTRTNTPASPHTPSVTPTFTRTNTPTNTRTSTATSTLTPAGIIVGHVMWQGISQPDTRNQGITGTLTLCVGGVPQSYPVTTDAGGYFTVTTGLPDGGYNWRVKGQMNLANVGTLNLSGSFANVEMALLRAGDSDNSNVVNSTDFNILRATFGTGNDLRADFNKDGVVNSVDFSMLRGNFGQAGGTLGCP